MDHGIFFMVYHTFLYLTQKFSEACAECEFLCSFPARHEFITDFILHSVSKRYIRTRSHIP